MFELLSNLQMPEKDKETLNWGQTVEQCIKRLHTSHGKNKNWFGHLVLCIA